MKKRCPYCEELIESEAIKCMYCREFISSDLKSSSENAQTSVYTNNANMEEETQRFAKLKRKRTLHIIDQILVTSVLIIMAIFAIKLNLSAPAITFGCMAIYVFLNLIFEKKKN